MEQTTYFDHVGLSSVVFHQPDEQTRQKLTAKWNKEMRRKLITLILCAIPFTFLFLLCYIIPGLIVGTIFIIYGCCMQKSIKDTENISVRFGTVTDHYPKIVHRRKKSYTVYCSTIRLDDSNQIVDDVRLDPRKFYKEPIGRQVLIASYRDFYQIFPAEFSESPPPPDVPEPAFTGHSYETTIDRIAFEEVSPDTLDRVRHTLAKRRTHYRILKSILPIIIFGGFSLPFLQILSETLWDNAFVFYWLAGAFVIMLFVILHIRDLIRFKQVTGLPVRLLHFSLSNEFADFQVPGTGQIVRKKHIRYYFCKGDQIGNIVLLIRLPDYSFAILPND
ncbi:MAG: hypothetical protein J5722_10570 [Oscillospiraceae bacterium]|nr:hypothetical protein [Oscillospiraceae bacterium]